MGDYLSKVSVLLVVTNEAEYLQLFCDALKKQNYAGVSLFILDNNCEDNSIEIIKSYFPQANILHVDENIGFACGNNLLAEKAIMSGTELLFVLNPDIELDENCISALVRLINQEENIAAVAPIMFLGHELKNNYKIQSYADKIDFKKRHVESLQGNQIFVDGKYPQEIVVNIVSGGITFIKAIVVKEIGLFDERYFIYGEEADLAYRSFLAGYKMVVTSEAKVWHHHDWSPKNKLKYYFSYYYMNRSKILYFIKYRFFKSLIATILKEFIMLPIKIKWALKTADLKLLKYYYLGIWHGLLNKKGRAIIEFK